MLELSRIATAAGWTAFGVGFTIYGIGLSVRTEVWETNFGLILAIVGVIVGTIGMIAHRQLFED